ncbi:Sensor histidine kinase TmoS [Microbulbifer aggregans]|uniref:histidine kinase n=2 Tax=Microbulbifer aggregans TaxID=1769779 RepID=A0A1C9W5W4_9GAMM|nr:Sensor histidine kinase TmoS [Microbulbifer aggregans]
MVLRPKARILKTLGEELISSETVALIELVKNAYDADARNVLIRFEGELKKGEGAISVIDDGHGMDDNTIQNSWMVIATDKKKTQRKSKSGNRRLLGEKGVGRFSAARIAEELDLITRPTESDTEFYAFFDWRQFDNPDLFLDEIEFLMEERAPETIVNSWPLEGYLDGDEVFKGQGTVVRMNSLKHTWESKDLKELQRGLSRLISPFNSISDFNIYIEMPDAYGEFSSQVEPPEIIKYPHYIVNGSVDSKGKYRFDVTVEAKGKKESFEGYFISRYRDGVWEVFSLETEADLQHSNDKLRYLECGQLNFKLRVWDRDELDNVMQKIGVGVRSVRKDLDAIAGINIYRDGFRVLPYGEPNNDWLRLDLRRVQNPTRNLSNNQITGYISITADGNPGLHDRSNREGLDQNTAYSDLANIMHFVLTKLETIRYIEKRSSKNQKNIEKPGQGNLFSSPDFGSIKKVLVDEQAKPGEAIGLINKVESDWNRKVQTFKSVISQYHALATLGGIVDKVLHDGRQPLATIQTEAGLGKEITEELIGSLPDISPGQISDFKSVDIGLGRIIDQANILRDVFRRVEPFGGRKRGRPKKYYIEDVIKDTFSIYDRDFKSTGVRVQIPSSQTLVSVDITELSEILTNLITNSIYWLNSVPRGQRKIKVMVSRLSGDSLEIVFADTGPGIKEEHRNHIFEPYFSDREGGHGLGLCLVGEIAKDYYNGSVELLDTGKNNGAVFRIVLNKRV